VLHAYIAEALESQFAEIVESQPELLARRAVHEYVAHYRSERNHQGKSNVLLFPRIMEKRGEGSVRCRERLGGLLRYYYQDAA
jgi:hypothetical protein